MIMGFCLYCLIVWDQIKNTSVGMKDEILKSDKVKIEMG